MSALNILNFKETEKKLAEHVKEIALENKKRRREQLFKYSMIDELSKNANFKNFKVDEYNKNVYNLAKKYIDNFDGMLEHNIGLLITGSVGTGKTYITASIANELLERDRKVVMLSFTKYLEMIKETFNQNGKTELEILEKINEAELLIIDDLGAENESDWSREKLYSLIDYRYRTNRLMIITTNYSAWQMKEKFKKSDGVDRVLDRIIESCVFVELKGKSRRGAVADVKRQKLKELLSGE